MRKWAILLCVAAPLSAPLLAQDSQESQPPEGDRGFVEGLLEDNLSGDGRVVDVQGFAGALSSTATIDKLTIADDQGVWLTLTGVTLNWNRSALLSGRLEVAELSAKEVLLPRRPVASTALPSAEATPLALPDLPVSINIAKLAIDRVDLGAPVLGQAAVISLTGAAFLAEGSGTAQLSVLRSEPQAGQLAFSASYARETQDLALNLALEEPANGLVSGLLGLPGQPALALSVTGQGPISDFTADITLGSDGQRRLAGQVTLTGAEGATQFNADLGGDIAPLFAPEYQAFFGPDMRLGVTGARAEDGAVTLDRLNLTADALAVSGRMVLAADGWPVLAQLTANLTPKDGRQVLLPLSGPQTRLGAARLTLGYDAGQGDTWTLRTDLTGLDRPDLALQSARLTADGTLHRDGTGGGQVDGAAEISLLGLSPADAALASALGRDLRAALHFDWTTGKDLNLQSVTVTGQGYDLTGEAQIATVKGTADIRVDTRARLVAQDLSRFAALAGQPLAGAGDLSVTGRIQPISGAFDLTVDGQTRALALGQPMLDPLLEGTGQVHLTAQRDASGTRLPALDIRTDHARITGNGTLSSTTTEAHVNAELTDLKRIIPDLSGPATLTADLSRQAADWTLKADASGPGTATAQITGTATGLDWADLRVTGAARAEARDLSAYAALIGQPVSGALTATLDGSGQPAAGAFDGTVEVNGQRLATGFEQLDQVLGNATRFTATGGRDAAGKYALKSADLTTPEVTGSARAPDGQAIEFTGKLRDLALLAPGLSGPASTSGTATPDGDNWRIEATGAGPGNTNLRASGTVAQDGKTLNMALSGASPLALINDLIRPRSISGTASYDLRLSGRPALGSVSGKISARDARFTLPDQALALENIAADVTLGGAQAQVNMTGQVSSGGGIRVSGPVGLEAPFSAALEATLTEVKLTDPKLFETSVNGTISVNGPLTGGARIGGRLVLGQTELRVPNASGTNYADLPGLTHVNEPAAVFRTRQNAGLVAAESDGSGTGPIYDLDIQVLANERIFVRGRGLDAELGGALRVQGTTQNVVPQGRFDLIRGRLDILGKRLTLDEGQISLQGAFDPYLRFVASTETSDATASITIEGQASAPELTFTSSPELPQDEVLALILFGKEISTISPLQAVRLAAAVRTLTGKGGDGLGGTLRKGLALDDLDVTTSDEGETEARAGKYLSENIYSEVTADTAGNSQINLNLNINRAVTARGRLSSDGETGIGIFIEKDY